MNRKNYKNNKVKNINNVDVSIYLADEYYTMITGTAVIDLSSDTFRFLAYNINGVETFNLSLYKKEGDSFIYQSTKLYNIDTNKYGFITIDDLQLLGIGEYKLVAGEQDVDEVGYSDEYIHPNHLFFTVTGERFINDLEIQEGWNLISTVTDKQCDIIDDSNIIENNIYNFSASLGYIEITTFKLLPSMGYWVKSNDNGTIRLIATPSSDNYQVNIRATRQAEEVQKAAIKTTEAIISSKNVIRNAMSGPSDSSRASYQSFIKKMQNEFTDLSDTLNNATNAIQDTTNNMKGNDPNNITALNKIVSSCSTNLKIDSDFSNIASEFANDSCSNNGGDGDDDGFRIKQNRKKSNKRIYTGYNTQTPLVVLNNAIETFDEAKKNFKYNPINDNYLKLESANDTIISALRGVVDQTATAGSNEDDAISLIQSIKANNSKGKPLENGEYTIVDLNDDYGWNDIENNISITIRNKYEILNQDFNYFLDKELVVNDSNWSKGSYVWDSTENFYVNEIDKTKFIKFLKYNTDSDDEDDIIRVVTSLKPADDGSQDSLVYLNETKPSILLEDGYYNIKIDKSDDKTIASIPKFLEDNQYQFTVKHDSANYSNLIEFYNSSLNLFYTFSKDYLGNAIIYTEDIPHSWNDDYVPDYDHKPLSIDFLEDGTLVLVNITDEDYGETYNNPPDYYYIGTWEKVDDLSKMSNNRLYKNSSNNYYYVPLNSNGLYLIYFQEESDLSKYDFLNKTIKSGKTLPIYQFHQGEETYIYLNHNDNNTFNISGYTETPIIFNFERGQYYGGGQILSQFADSSKYTIHLYGVDGYKEPQNLDSNNQNLGYPGWYYYEEESSWVWEFYEYEEDSQYFDRLQENKIIVKFDIKDKAKDEVVDTVKFIIQLPESSSGTGSSGDSGGDSVVTPSSTDEIKRISLDYVKNNATELEPLDIFTINHGQGFVNLKFNTLGSNFDTYMILIDSNNNIIGAANDDAPWLDINNPEIRQRSEIVGSFSVGTYYLIVTGGMRDDYILNGEKNNVAIISNELVISPPTPIGSVVVSYGSSIPGALLPITNTKNTTKEEPYVCYKFQIQDEIVVEPEPEPEPEPDSGSSSGIIIPTSERYVSYSSPFKVSLAGAYKVETEPSNGVLVLENKSQADGGGCNLTYTYRDDFIGESVFKIQLLNGGPIIEITIDCKSDLLDSDIDSSFEQEIKNKISSMSSDYINDGNNVALNRRYKTLIFTNNTTYDPKLIETDIRVKNFFEIQPGTTIHLDNELPTIYDVPKSFMTYYHESNDFTVSEYFMPSEGDIKVAVNQFKFRLGNSIFTMQHTNQYTHLIANSFEYKLVETILDSQSSSKQGIKIRVLPIKK